MFRIAVATVAALINLGISAFAHDVVCRAPGIDGMGVSAAHAKSIISNFTTSNKSEIRVYVEKNSTGYYYQSNFCTSSCAENYPTKIFSAKPISMKLALEMIIYPAEDRLPSELWDREYKELLSRSAKIFIDKSIFDSNGRPIIDTTGAGQIDVVSGEDKITLAGSVSSLDTDSPPPLLVKNIAGCCLDGFPPLAAAKILTGLKQASIKDNDVSFVSLVQDSATSNAIKTAKTLNAVQVPQSKLNSEESIRDVIAAAKGKTLIMLGHVEGDSFVTRDGGRNIVMQVSFSKLHQMALDNDVNLIHLGCNTANQIDDDTFGVGVAVKFNTVELVTQLDRALKTSSSFADLLTNLSSDGLKVVVSEYFLNKLQLSGYRADIYAHPRDDSSIWVKIGQFFNVRRNLS